jgi:1-phosphatidylinositol-4-phosphate 5-kinase
MNRRSVFKAGEGAGASGSFFFFSQDNRFLIKTVMPAEVTKMGKMLPHLVRHFTQMSNQSLIARIYGIFTIKTNYFAPLHIMIMQNSAFLDDPKQKLLTFDLKGSTIKRYVRVTPTNQGLKVLKDQNYLEIDKKKKIMRVSYEVYGSLESILRADSLFLMSQGIMDYSLLLVTEAVPTTLQTSLLQTRNLSYTATSFNKKNSDTTDSNELVRYSLPF